VRAARTKSIQFELLKLLLKESHIVPSWRLSISRAIRPLHTFKCFKAKQH